ncbi:hypothetical protein [uncultured Sutterella sp.]|uniref:hypothetical protein n=1 Tax=uncultured Sutterella sp. TaxID=286133 RepID=UPI0026140066|nr:hypothetical protein [uncultured Sutterella sp.]
MRLLTHSVNETFSTLHGDTSKRQEFQNSADLFKEAKSYTAAFLVTRELVDCFAGIVLAERSTAASGGDTGI